MKIDLSGPQAYKRERVEGGGGEEYPPIFNYNSSWKIVEDFLQQEIMFGERGRK